jgi:hypothetical protein
MDGIPEFEKELERAVSARAQGNEGRARVCARRAAGHAVRVYYARRGRQITSPSAHDLLLRLANDPSVQAGARAAAMRLTQRVSEQFAMPANVDLVADARALALALNSAEEGEATAPPSSSLT